MINTVGQRKWVSLLSCHQGIEDLGMLNDNTKTHEGEEKKM